MPQHDKEAFFSGTWTELVKLERYNQNIGQRWGLLSICSDSPVIQYNFFLQLTLPPPKSGSLYFPISGTQAPIPIVGEVEP